MPPKKVQSISVADLPSGNDPILAQLADKGLLRYSGDLSDRDVTLHAMNTFLCNATPISRGFLSAMVDSVSNSKFESVTLTQRPNVVGDTRQDVYLYGVHSRIEICPHDHVTYRAAARADAIFAHELVHAVDNVRNDNRALSQVVTYLGTTHGTKNTADTMKVLQDSAKRATLDHSGRDPLTTKYLPGLDMELVKKAPHLNGNLGSKFAGWTHYGQQSGFFNVDGVPYNSSIPGEFGAFHAEMIYDCMKVSDFQSVYDFKINRVIASISPTEAKLHALQCLSHATEDLINTVSAQCVKSAQQPLPGVDYDGARACLQHVRTTINTKIVEQQAILHPISTTVQQQVAAVLPQQQAQQQSDSASSRMHSSVADDIKEHLIDQKASMRDSKSARNSVEKSKTCTLL